ncbi:DUF3349 domain-containing protein [Nocardioides sp. LHG3406-4]|uniref:DUF3349 domain-containing protein n=1 Tax=Nocardioides sp. LHG3406-4 TaxID=2804575 RepID=UPI003CE8EA84
MATADGERAAPVERDHLIARVVRWLRAGYPDGVPPQCYVALLGILRRALTAKELDDVVAELTSEAATGEETLTAQLVQQRIAEVVKGPIDDTDVARVSARLAAARWPLGSPLAAEADPGAGFVDSRRGLVARIVAWLRDGYPAGLPTQDYLPLLALLRRRLSDDEVVEVGNALAVNGVVEHDRLDIGSAIASVTAELPSEDDIERVRGYLAEHGWPTEFTS